MSYKIWSPLVDYCSCFIMRNSADGETIERGMKPRRRKRRRGVRGDKVRGKEQE